MLIACGGVITSGPDAGEDGAVVADAHNEVNAGEASVAPDAAIIPGCGVQPGAPWPMVGHDAVRSSRSSVDGPRTLATRWSFACDSNSSPAVGADGTIYIELLEGTLVAIDANGSQKWPVGGVGNYGSATIGCDGTIFVEGPHRYDEGSHAWVDDLLLAFTPTGKLLWTLTDVAPVSMDDNGPAPDTDGLLYYARAGLYGIGVDGTLRFRIPGDVGSPRVAVNDAGVAFGGIEVGDGGSLLAFGPDGGIVWEHAGVGQGTILTDGTFVVAMGNSVTAYSSTGIELWSAATNRSRMVAVSPSGRIYVGTSDGVIALDSTHASKLLYAWPDYFDGYLPSIAIDASGWVYGSLNHHVVALRPDDSVAFDLDLGTDYIDGTSLALSAGTLYVATYKHLIAIGP